MELLRNRGINKLNIDLIYGLPHQTLAGMVSNVDFALSLDPDRLAVFGYAHVPHFKKHQQLISEKSLPDERARPKQAVLVNATLAARGYVAVGLDHFAKPDDPLAVAQREHRLVRNFQGYTTDNAPILVGLGASSIGSLPQGYVQNHTEVRAYRAAIDEGFRPVERGIALTDDDRLRRAIIERLMCDLEVDLGAMTVRYDRALEALAGPLINLTPLIADGIVRLDGSRLSVNPQWRIFIRPVCAAFDTYLGISGAVHSKAV